MSTSLASPSSAITGSVAPTTPVWRLSLEQYHAMIATGILSSEDPIEFLEGVLVPKMTRNPPHRIALAHLRDLLVAIVGAEWHVESQEAITLESSEPEPDLAIVRGTVDDYPDRHPGSEDIAFVAEVSDSTLTHDRDLKKRIYARAGIAEYWIVHLIDRQIEVYTDPTGPAAAPDYRQHAIYGAGQTIPVILGGVPIGTISVTDVLPTG